MEPYSATLPSGDTTTMPPHVTMRTRLRLEHDCSTACHCACHRSSLWAMHFSKFLGNLFVGYSGVPSLRRRCNLMSCSSKVTSTCVSICYKFPSWFVAKALSFTIRATRQQSISVSLQLQTAVNPHDEIMLAAKYGDNERIKSLITDCPSHVNDVDYNGRSVLQVGLCPVHVPRIVERS